MYEDACLPNFILGDDGLNGYIDLVDLGVGDVEVDLSAVWSSRRGIASPVGATLSG